MRDICDHCGNILQDGDLLKVILLSIWRRGVPDPFYGVPSVAMETYNMIKIAHQDCDNPGGKQKWPAQSI